MSRPADLLTRAKEVTARCPKPPQSLPPSTHSEAESHPVSFSQGCPQWNRKKNLSFSYISTPEYIFLIFCVMKWEVRITHSLCIQKCSGCQEGNWIHMNAWIVSGNHSGTGFLARICLKMRWACHFKENSWQNLIPMIKFKVSCESDNSGKLYFGPLELDSSSIFKDSSNEIGGNHRSFYSLNDFAFSRTAQSQSHTVHGTFSGFFH